jgi:hypothetical protein
VRFKLQFSGIAFLLVLVTAPIQVPAQAKTVEVVYQPSSKKIVNPERGYYVQITAKSEGKALSRQRLEKLRSRGITLVLRMYYLKEFKDKPLSPEQLNLIKQDFATLRQAGCKCILRFGYCSRIGEDDAPQAVVLQHITQLQPLLRDNVDVIAVFQTGFVGPWGEMHSSTHGLTEPKSLQLLVDRLLGVMPPSRSIQVRTPLLKEISVGTTRPVTRDTAFTNSAVARIGHYNDCFLANSTDEGTYQKSRIVTQKRNLELDTQYVPMGGETCSPSKYTAVNNARMELSRMHWTYLNIEYHAEVILEWRKLKFLAEVEQKLGYRLSLVSSLCSSEVSKMGELSLVLRLTNTGWAAPINPHDVVIFAKHEDTADQYQVKLPVDPRYWLPEKPITVKISIGIPAEMPAGNYRLFLLLADPEPRLSDRVEYTIRLANKGLWDAQTGKHDLNQTITVTSKTTEAHKSSTHWFEQIPNGGRR